MINFVVFLVFLRVGDDDDVVDLFFCVCVDLCVCVCVCVLATVYCAHTTESSNIPHPCFAAAAVIRSLHGQGGAPSLREI